MANNRLYIVDTKTKEHICIAKSDGYEWGLGNVNILASFLEQADVGDKSTLVIGTENDEEFFKTYILPTESANHENTWEYYNPS